jgi:hypothetical protein
MQRIKNLWSNESNECLTQKEGSKNYIFFKDPQLIQIKDRRCVISQPCALVYVGITNTLHPSKPQNSEVARRVGNLNYQFKHLRGSILKLRNRALEWNESFLPNPAASQLDLGKEELDDLERPYKMTVYCIEYPNETESQVLAKFPTECVLNKIKGTNELPKLIYVVIMYVDDSPIVEVPISVRICYDAPSPNLYLQLTRGGFRVESPLDYNSMPKPKFILREEIAALLRQVKELNHANEFSDEELLQLLHSE